MVRKKLLFTVLTFALILSALGASSLTVAQTQVTPTVQNQTRVTSTVQSQTNPSISQLAANNVDLSTFASLLNKANLTKYLNGSGNFTVFAPTNAAFAKLNATVRADLENNSTTLKRVLRNHIAYSRFYAINFNGTGRIKTLAGDKLSYVVNPVTGVRVNNASVTKMDLNASNGVMHLINGVLIPSDQAAATTTATASTTGGFLGLPGFEVSYAAATLLAVAYAVLRRRK